MNQKHSRGPFLFLKLFYRLLKLDLPVLIISYFSVSKLVSINSFPNANISGLSIGTADLGEELGTVAFVFSFSAVLRAVHPKPKPIQRALRELEIIIPSGDPLACWQRVPLSKLKEILSPSNKTLCKSTWLVGRAQTEFQLPLSFTTCHPCAGHNLNNHRLALSILPLPCKFHGESFEKDVFLFPLV